MAPSEPQGKVALQWAGVSVAFGDRTVLHEVDLQVRQGETLALVGESGSGKTLCCMAALGLLPEGRNTHAWAHSGPGGTWANVGREGDAVPIPRGRQVTMVFQEPMTSLNPTMRCGAQLSEVIRRHSAVTAEAAREQVSGAVRGGAADRSANGRIRPIPTCPVRGAKATGADRHGAGQRALKSSSPTSPPRHWTARCGRSCSTCIAEIQRKRGLALVLVTHDMDVVERAADQAGSAVPWQSGGARAMQNTVLGSTTAPVHPRAAGLSGAQNRPAHLRCRCWRTFSPVAAPSRTLLQVQISPPAEGQPLLLEVRGAGKTYPGSQVPALAGVDLQLRRRGDTLGVVGGSGCGKTTLARAILGLHRFDTGTIQLAGQIGRMETRRSTFGTSGPTSGWCFKTPGPH